MPDSQLPFVRRCLTSGDNFADFQWFWGWFKDNCDTQKVYSEDEAAAVYDFWKRLRKT